MYATNWDGPSELDVPTDVPMFRDGVEIRYYPVQRPRFWGFSSSLAQALRSSIREYDIVHIHSLYLFHGMVAAHYCRKHGIPYVVRPHGTLHPYIYRRHRLRKSVMELLFERRNIKRAAAIHFATEEEKNLSEPYTYDLTPSFVVPNGLDLTDYENLPDEGTFRARYPETGEKKIILFFSRVNFVKGLDILVRAFARVARLRDDVHLVIAGPDNEGFGDKVRVWLKDEKVLHRATFTGMLLGDNKLAVFRDAQMFVLPSYSESFSISTVEAMACGLPVVVSDKVNVWREVEASGAGRVAPCDAGRFAEAILDVLDSLEEAKRMGERGRALVKERFQWKSVALALEAAYQSILSEGATSSQGVRGMHK